MNDPPHIGPRISRNVASLLDNPDVLPEGVPHAWSDWLSPEDSLYDTGDCRHGCNGDCVASGSEVCSFTCHAPQSPEDHQIA